MKASPLLPLLPRLLLALAAAASGSTQAQTAQPPTRGQMLYDTHCVTCHTVQMHWRKASVVRSWQDLQDQVTRWQSSARLGWSQDDITQVARYLNDTFYRMPQTGGVAKRE
jgi:mono/diheme cytochrome c family protein